MHSLFSILPLLATALLTSASPAPRTYQTLSLPVDFDLSHPALDYAAHAAALAANPNAVIPQLPADILALAQTVKVDDITADADTVICETSGRSPTRADGLDVGNSLERNGPSLCCHTGGQYTVMWYGG